MDAFAYLEYPHDQRCHVSTKPADSTLSAMDHTLSRRGTIFPALCTTYFTKLQKATVKRSSIISSPLLPHLSSPSLCSMPKAGSRLWQQKTTELQASLATPCAYPLLSERNTIPRNTTHNRQMLELHHKRASSPTVEYPLSSVYLITYLSTHHTTQSPPSNRHRPNLLQPTQPASPDQ